MLTQADVDALVKQWVNSPDGKRYLKAEGVGIYTEQEMRAIAGELRTAIASAFVGIQTSGGVAGSMGSFDLGATAITQSGENKLEITFKPSALQRKSLLHVTNPNTSTYGTRDKNGKAVKRKLTKSNIGYTGNGLRDVFAAFTSGWHAHAYAYGSWEEAYQTGFRAAHSRSQRRTSIRSRKDYEGNSFIKDTCSNFEAKYPGLTITIPAEWGG